MQAALWGLGRALVQSPRALLWSNCLPETSLLIHHLTNYFSMRVIRMDTALTAQTPASWPSDPYTYFTILQVRVESYHSRWDYIGRRLSSTDSHWWGYPSSRADTCRTWRRQDKHAGNMLPAEPTREIEPRHPYVTFYSAWTPSPPTGALFKVLK